MAAAVGDVKHYFRRLRDPRCNRRKRHLLMDVILITICGVVSGCDDWQQIEVFARGRLDRLRKFLSLPNGVPSHDTLERVVDRLDPAAFQRCFRDWMRSLHEGLGLAQIAIDGKTLRGSATDGRKALHLVSAWATANALSLGQVATEEKSNEVTAIPKLLELLRLHGALATIDAMGCQKEIAAAVGDRGGDYVLTVKGNQPNLSEDVQECFTRASDVDFRGCDYDEWETDERGHGRTEKRSYTILRDPQGIRGVEAWKGLCVAGMCVSEGLRDGKESHDVRYFIGSRRADAKTYGAALRNHWRIENSLHWQSDVSFGEDGDAVGGRRSAENSASVRRLALSVLKQHPEKRSIACKRLRAALETSFLEQVLCGDVNSDNV